MYESNQPVSFIKLIYEDGYNPKSAINAGYNPNEIGVYKCLDFLKSPEVSDKLSKIIFYVPLRMCTDYSIDQFTNQEIVTYPNSGSEKRMKELVIDYLKMVTDSKWMYEYKFLPLEVISTQTPGFVNTYNSPFYSSTWKIELKDTACLPIEFDIKEYTAKVKELCTEKVYNKLLVRSNKTGNFNPFIQLIVAASLPIRFIYTAHYKEFFYVFSVLKERKVDFMKNMTISMYIMRRFNDCSIDFAYPGVSTTFIGNDFNDYINKFINYGFKLNNAGDLVDYLLDNKPELYKEFNNLFFVKKDTLRDKYSKVNTIPFDDLYKFTIPLMEYYDKIKIIN